MAQTADIPQRIARLDAEALEHKRLERAHRRRAIEASRQRDELIAFCEANGIPVIREPDGAR